MSFAAPIWLLGLVPWAALAAWLLTGRRDEARVPFVHLWPRAAAPVRTRRSIHAPPIALACLLLAMLLAVVAAAGPMMTRTSDTRAVTLVVDLAVTSPIAEASTLTLTPARLMLVNGEANREADPSAWLDQLNPRSSLATLSALRSAVQDALARDDRPVVVLSNQKLGIDSDRLIQATSTTEPRNVGIVRVAARKQQVMLTVRNQSSQTRAELVVASEGGEQRQTIDLPPPNSETNVFVDLPTLGRVVSVELIAKDDIDVDNRAWLVRQPAWPAIEVRATVPAELTRVIDVYRQLRTSGEGSTRIAVSTSAVEGPAVIIASTGASEPVASPVRAADHPINANVDWRTLSNASAARAPSDGWTPIVTSGDRPLVAVREGRARQVWVGIDADDWSRDSSFVIFWTNVFDWLGHGGGDAFVWQPVQRLGPEWRRLDDLSGPVVRDVDPAPGVWGRGDGALRALNAIDLKLDPPPPSDWRAKLAALKPAASARANLSKPALVAALCLALIASLTWGWVKRAPAPA